MVRVHYLDLGAAREIEERTGKNAIDFMDIPDDGENMEYETEPVFHAEIKNADGVRVWGADCTQPEHLKNTLCSKIKELDINNNCYTFSLYEVEQ